MPQSYETGLHNTCEVGRLRKVMLHRPGRELENLMPEYLEQLRRLAEAVSQRPSVTVLWFLPDERKYLWLIWHPHCLLL